MISESVLRLAAALGPAELASAIGATKCPCSGGSCRAWIINRMDYELIPTPSRWGIQCYPDPMELPAGFNIKTQMLFKFVRHEDLT